MINHKPIHAPLAQFAVIDDCLHIGGLPLTQLAQRVGKSSNPVHEVETRLERGLEQLLVANVVFEVAQFPIFDMKIGIGPDIIELH